MSEPTWGQVRDYADALTDTIRTFCGAAQA
jgi:hypothetical protein